MTVDTSWAVAVFNAADSGHAGAWALYRRLVDGEVPIAMCRPLLQMEFWSALIKTSNGLKPREVERLIEEAERRLEVQATLRLRTMDRRDRASIRRHLLHFGEHLLWNGLRTLDIVEVRLTHGLVARSKTWAEDFGLMSRDALHLEVATTVARGLNEEVHLATLDSDFDVVPGLHVWGRDGR